MNKLSLKKTPAPSGEYTATCDIDLKSRLEQIRRKFKTTNFMYGLSGENILSGRCIYRDEANKLSVYIPSHKRKDTEILGISISTTNRGDRICVAKSGIVTNDAISFEKPAGSAVWVGYEGNVTDIMPTFGPTQLIGFSIDRNTVFVTSAEYDCCGYSIEIYDRQKPSNIWNIPCTDRAVIQELYTSYAGRYKKTSDYSVTFADGLMKIQLPEKAKGRVVYSLLQ